MYTTPNLTEKLKAKNITNFDFSGKRVLIRSCLNVPVSKSGRIEDFARLDEAIPTIKMLREKADKVIILAHLGRPTTARESEFSLKPVQAELEKRLGQTVEMIETESEFQDISESHSKYFILENIRFFEGEESKDIAKKEEFSKKLASLADLYVNDAFPDYRESVSTFDLAKLLPSFLGPVFVKEVEALSKFSNPKRPFVAILGGSKLSEKLDALNALAKTADRLLISGAMAYTLLLSEGKSVGKSLVEQDKIEVAKEIMQNHKDKILLPIDHAVANEFDESSSVENINDVNIPDGKIALDIGPETIKLFVNEIQYARSILWNGPAGVFEWKNTKTGTLEIGKVITRNSKAYKLAGGGDSISAINKFGLTGFDHISTGGGAMLAFLSYDEFPTLDIIINR